MRYNRRKLQPCVISAREQSRSVGRRSKSPYGQTKRVNADCVSASSRRAVIPDTAAIQTQVAQVHSRRPSPVPCAKEAAEPYEKPRPVRRKVQLEPVDMRKAPEARHERRLNVFCQADIAQVEALDANLRRGPSDSGPVASALKKHSSSPQLSMNSRCSRRSGALRARSEVASATQHSSLSPEWQFSSLISVRLSLLAIAEQQRATALETDGRGAARRRAHARTKQSVHWRRNKRSVNRCHNPEVEHRA